MEGGVGKLLHGGGAGGGGVGVVKGRDGGVEEEGGGGLESRPWCCQGGYHDGRESLGRFTLYNTILSIPCLAVRLLSAAADTVSLHVCACVRVCIRVCSCMCVCACICK